MFGNMASIVACWVNGQNPDDIDTVPFLVLHHHQNELRDFHSYQTTNIYSVKKKIISHESPPT